MASSSTRQRLIQAALDLFVSQGINNTTTRQIANLAEVNEVTLFRQFGNKYGLLLAVLEESPAFTQLGEVLVQQVSAATTLENALREYAQVLLHALEDAPEFVRSLIGEADQYSEAIQRTLSQRLTETNRYVANYLEQFVQQENLSSRFTAEKITSLLNGVLLGYIAIKLTSGSPELWADREEFLDDVVQLFLRGSIFTTESITASIAKVHQPLSNQKICDLSAVLVHQILLQARRAGTQDYALAYVLFASGLSAAEVVHLQTNHLINNAHQSLLQITSSATSRQVPLNLWILGKRYGSPTNSPLTRWLKNRKDRELAMFLGSSGQPITEAEIRIHWQQWTENLLTPEGEQPTIGQAQQTWCIDLLMRGMSLENLSILTGWDLFRLQPYAQRAREKAAIEQAALLDQKPRNSSPRKAD